MKTRIIAGLLALLLAPATAQASGLGHTGSALLTLSHHRVHHHARRKHPSAQPVAPALTPCPNGVPVQMITIVDETGQNMPMVGIENALVAQSLQLRAAWNTPCVQFGAGGWPIYLSTGIQTQPDGSTSYQLGGYHCGSGNPHCAAAPTPSAYVQTGMLTWTTGAARALSHELVEMLVNPSAGATTTLPDGSQMMFEVADPVEDTIHNYDVGGYELSDFILPSYLHGGPAPWDEGGSLATPAP